MIYVSLTEKLFWCFLVRCFPDFYENSPFNPFFDNKECPEGYICDKNWICSKLNKPGNLWKYIYNKHKHFFLSSKILTKTIFSKRKKKKDFEKFKLIWLIYSSQLFTKNILTNFLLSIKDVLVVLHIWCIIFATHLQYLNFTLIFLKITTLLDF